MITIIKLSQTKSKTAMSGSNSYVPASPFWDPYLQHDIDSLERIQRKAARFTTRDYRQRSSVTAMLHDLRWEPLAVLA